MDTIQYLLLFLKTRELIFSCMCGIVLPTAPVVKWISLQSSELSFQVRVLAGAQEKARRSQKWSEEKNDGKRGSKK